YAAVTSPFPDLTGKAHDPGQHNSGDGTVLHLHGDVAVQCGLRDAGPGSDLTEGIALAFQQPGELDFGSRVDQVPPDAAVLGRAGRRWRRSSCRCRSGLVPGGVLSVL